MPESEAVYADQHSTALDQQYDTQSGWQALLQLGFERRKTKTILAQRQHQGPLTVQRPFYPEGGLCHVYLLHPPGGVVAGDRLSINVHAATASEALITTPAAGKFYRSSGALAKQDIVLRVDEDAVLEWLPQENILFNGVNLRSEIQLQLVNKARFLGWEIVALGRPAADKPFTQGQAMLSWRIFRDQQYFFQESMRLDAKAFQARWGLHGFAVFGTLIACPATEQHREAVNDLIGNQTGKGVTLLDDLLVCRASDHKSEPLKRFFENVRRILRKEIVHRDNCDPRIWAT